MEGVYDLMNCIDKKTGAQLEALIEDNGKTHIFSDEDKEVGCFDSIEEARKDYTIF